MEDAIPDIADRVFREALEDWENLRAIVRDVLPELAEGFDFAQRKILPRDFLLPNWKGRERDMFVEGL